jgi:hypothetical protein
MKGGIYMVRRVVGTYTNPKTGKSQTAYMVNKEGRGLGIIFGALVGICTGILSGMVVKSAYEDGVNKGAEDYEKIEEETLRDLDIIVDNVDNKK